MCYEDLKQLYASAAKERDELKKELECMKRLHEMSKVELEVCRNQLKWAEAERDTVTKRMIELEGEKHGKA